MFAEQITKADPPAADGLVPPFYVPLFSLQ
jgi:hypothetical protein